jgi:hypothetical protein
MCRTMRLDRGNRREDVFFVDGWAAENIEGG